MKLLAIDPSSTILGWAVFEGEALTAFGIIKTKKVLYDQRFMYIVGELRELHRQHHFTEIACERAIRFQGRRIPALEVAVTSIRKWAEMNKLKISFYSPSEWRLSVAGTGKADKEMIARIIHLLYPGIDREITDHETDAIGIGQHHYGIRRLEMMEAKNEDTRSH